MAAQFFNRIGQLGLTVAVAGGVINSALYNGRHIVKHLILESNLMKVPIERFCFIGYSAGKTLI